MTQGNLMSITNLVTVASEIKRVHYLSRIDSICKHPIDNDVNHPSPVQRNGEISIFMLNKRRTGYRSIYRNPITANKLNILTPHLTTEIAQTHWL